MFSKSSKAFLGLIIENCQNKRVLDYGCGDGHFLKTLEELGAKKVIGIDSTSSDGVIEMDCENMTFPDDYFDLVVEAGTMPYLNKEKAFSEVSRVLKPNGKFIGLETLGHNPITNLYRKFAKKDKTRQSWGVEEILKVEDLNTKYLKEIKREYFYFSFLRKYAYKIIFVLEKNGLSHNNRTT